ncbi:MAG: hypothetical protein H6656_16610 [Ardenticatenaceae bacterium]|nr:hypothetical protein [Ardenticatenaceae bacterium]
MSTLSVTIDERLRLVTAVLSISDWPVDEQKQLTHAVHPQAKQVRQFLPAFSSHPAVNGANEALLNGVALADLFSAALRCTWPDFTPTAELPHVLKIKEWVQSLADFARRTALVEQFWPQHTAVWAETQKHLEEIFTGDQLLDCLAQLHGSTLVTAVTLMPNLIFPALSPVVATSDSALTLLLPPPKAVGESPPWPFAEDPGWVVATVAQQLAPYLLADELAQLDEAQKPLALHLAAAYCLAQLLDEFEAQAYLLRAKKEHNLPQLPILFAQLQEEVGGGNGRSLTTILH